MRIKAFETSELQQCAQLLIAAYNCPPWNNHWTTETAQRYLQEFVDCKRFVGFTLLENDTIIGVAFCHEKTWWTKDELFIDEFYIAPNYQRQGYGRQLLQAIEEYCQQHELGGYTLLTNRYMPARQFYEKHHLIHTEHVIFMYKEV